jgi:hypothetical protein
LFANIDYVRVGRLDDLREVGYLKIILKGRQIIIVCSDSGLVAMDLDSALDPWNQTALPSEFHRSRSDSLSFLAGSYGEDWGKLVIYPVKIDGNDVLIGFNPFN